MKTSIQVRRLFLLAGCLVIGALACGGAWGRHLVRIFPRSALRRRFILSRGFQVVLSKPGVFVDVLLGEDELDHLQRIGYRCKVLQHDTDAILRRIRETPGFGEYTTYDEMVMRLRGQERRYPHLMEVHDVGDTWEKVNGIADRDILAVEVTARTGEGEGKPEVLLHGGIHARELATTEVLLRFLDHLLRSYGRDPEVTRLLEDRRIWIIPCLNPDGREYVFRQDWWWRKNRHRFGQDACGVDLNRNFAFRWGGNFPWGGASNDPNSPIYRGEAPFSEPETRAVRDFILSRPLSLTLSFHSYGGFVLIPYGFNGKVAEDPALLQPLAAEVGRLLGYSYGTPRQTLGYFSCGRHDDWIFKAKAYGVNPLPIEIEMGDTFFPAPEELDGIERSLRPVNLYVAHMAGPWLEVTVGQAVVDSRSGRLRIRVTVENKGLKTAYEPRLRVDLPDTPVNWIRQSWQRESLEGVRGKGTGKGGAAVVSIAGTLTSVGGGNREGPLVAVLTYGCRYGSSRSRALSIGNHRVE